MSHRYLLGLLLGVSLPGVLATAQDSPAQDPAEKHLLRYRLKTGTKGYFVLHQETAMKMNMGGQPMNTDMDMQMFVEFEVADEVVDGNAWSVRQTIYRVKMQVKNPMMGTIDYDSDDEDSDPGMLAQVEEMVGQSFRMNVDERGNVSDFEISEKMQDQLERVIGGDTKGMFTQLFAVLPDEPVAVGETWQTTTSQTMGQMGKAEVKVENKLVELDGDRVTLDQKMQIDLGAMETPFDMKMEVKKATGTTVLDLTKGYPVRSSVKMQMGMKTETEGMKMDVEMDMNISVEPGTPPTKKEGER